MTVPGALEIIHEAVNQLSDTDLMIGAGTVLDGPTARAAILTTPPFVVGPTSDSEVVRICTRTVSRSCQAP